MVLCLIYISASIVFWPSWCYCVPSYICVLPCQKQPTKLIYKKEGCNFIRTSGLNKPTKKHTQTEKQTEASFAARKIETKINKMSHWRERGRKNFINFPNSFTSPK